MATLAVAAVSARLLAEAAARDGFAVVALDCFGDADTRRASAAWHSIAAAPGALAIDPARTLAALREAAARGDAIGWIAGAGFEALPDAVEAGAALLPLLGTAADARRRLHDPRSFFARLDALGIAHPETRFEAPADAAGWLVKEAGGHGGWHVRRAESGGALPPGGYCQREQPGVPMSATFLADRRRAHVLGFNRQLVRAFGTRPYVHAGCIGPLPLPARAAREVEAALQALVREFGVCGLGSLDFLLDGASVAVLELNARPSASLALYGAGWLSAHVAACRDGTLPAVLPAPPADVGGHEIVYARHAFTLGDAAAAALAAAPQHHDLPAAGTRFAAGDPVCSHDARADDLPRLEARLAAQREALRTLLETP